MIRIAFLAAFICLGTVQAQTLRSLATAHGLNIGAAVTFPGSPAVYDTTLVHQYNAVVCENAMKMGNIYTGATTFSYTGADAIVNFGATRGMYVRGHNFLWHKQLPTWFSNLNVSRDSTFKIMKYYINSEMTHFKGKINEWDIVNEGVARDSSGMRLGSGYSDNTQNSKWAALTDAANHNFDYIDSAFTYARQADSNVLLVYNDYDCEGMGKKSDMVYNIVAGLKSKKLVDVIGLQCHFWSGSSTSGSNGAWVPSQMVTNLQRLAALGLRISLTEVDIRVATPIDSTKAARQKADYQTLMSICLAQPQCKTFITWGVNDQQSWVPGSFSGYGSALLFDNTTTNGEFTQKTTYAGVVAAFTNPTLPTGIMIANHGKLKMLRAPGKNSDGLIFDLKGRKLNSIPFNPEFAAHKPF